MAGQSARRRSVGVDVGGVVVGGGHPIVVQSMTNTDTADVESTVRQVAALKSAHDFPSYISDRVVEVRERNARTGKKYGIDPDFMRMLQRELTSLRRLLGIRSEQALELFHQTVSMKSVGNLNDFVRDHMLEPSDSTERVREIIGHFEDLTKAHDAVKRAREQLERPMWHDEVQKAGARADGAVAVEQVDRRRSRAAEPHPAAVTAAGHSSRLPHSTVTDLARLRGWSTSVPFAQAT